MLFYIANAGLELTTSRDSIVKFGLNMRRDAIGTVGLYNTVARTRLATVREDTVGQTSLGAHAEHTLQWNEWLRSVAELRSDFYRFNVVSNLAANSGRSSDHITSPKFSLIFGPFSRTEYFLSMGRGFHSNDGRGTVTHVAPGTLAPLDPVPALVRSKGVEVGVRSEWMAKLQSSLALWRLSLDSELLFVGDAGTTQASRPSERSGVEWSNRYRPTNWLIIEADLSVSRARFSNAAPAGERIPGSINRVAALGAAVDSLGPWSGALQMRYFGPRPLLADGSINSRSTLLWNSRLAYRIDRKLRLSLDVLNVANRKASDIDYFYASQLRGEAAPVNDTHLHPVEPRMLRLSMLANF